MPKELILHVGFHKSGTSAQQESHANQRDDLHKAGVLYPSIGKKAHHRVAWGLSQKPWGWKTRGAEKTPYKTFSRMASLINLSSAPKIILNFPSTSISIVFLDEFISLLAFNS
jgi:hypothetical protein